MRMLMTIVLLAAWLTSATTAAFAVGDETPPTLPGVGYAVEELGPVRNLTLSESGRHAAWKEQDRIRLQDGRTGEILDLPGPSLAPDGIGPNIRLNDKFVTWRVVTEDTFERTPLLLYKIGPRELVQVTDAAGINDSPVLLGGQLVWKGAVTGAQGGTETHVLLYDAWNDILDDLTPLSPRVEFLAGDGTTIAWADGFEPSRYTEIWALDLRSRQRWLLDEGESSRFNTKVVSDAVRWSVGTDPVEAKVAYLRRTGPCGELTAELALVAPALLWRRRRRAAGFRAGSGSRSCVGQDDEPARAGEPA